MGEHSNSGFWTLGIYMQDCFLYLSCLLSSPVLLQLDLFQAFLELVPAGLPHAVEDPHCHFRLGMRHVRCFREAIYKGNSIVRLSSTRRYDQLTPEISGHLVCFPVQPKALKRQICHLVRLESGRMGIRVLCQLGIDQSDCVLCRAGRVAADEDLAGGSLALGQVVVARR